MVMHARKPQRISDGYFEKHQSHPYQKYNSKSERRTTNEYVSSENRYTPLRSPNGNVSVHGHNTHSSQSGHGHHHYSHVADDRGYPSSRNAYLQKGSEKERDRDYKSSRNKYTDSVRSPKERSKDSERERSNHERNEHDKKNRTSGMNISVSRSSKYDKRSAPSASVSSGREWSEHISSSGKKYYYNCISEVSQWEKPREWDSRRTSSKDSTYSSRSIDATREQCEARTSHARHQYGDVNPGGISGAVAERHHPSELKAPYDMHMTGRDKRSSSRSGRREIEKSSKRTNSASERYWNSSREEEVHDRTRPKHSATPHDGKDGQSLQDMDISPDRSTPLSENSYGAREAAIVRNNAENSAVPPVVVLDNSNQQTGSLLAAALPRIVAVQPQVTIPPANNNGATASPIGICDGNRSGSGTPHRDPGPPTPTHSENIDPHAPPLHLDTALPRKMECLGSYSQVVGGTLHHAPPMLTPSLVNYVRSDLTSHVTGWPADILEKQANKFTEEAYQLGCLQCTRVSAELKCSRSLVRHTEIRATLQEQKKSASKVATFIHTWTAFRLDTRIMYLRQQISRLEELKSQNSFMSED